MKFFVTGGAGFVGSNFIRLVLASEKQYAVVNYVTAHRVIRMRGDGIEIREVPSIMSACQSVMLRLRKLPCEAAMLRFMPSLM